MHLLAFCMGVAFLPGSIQAEEFNIPHPSTYLPTYAEILKHKEQYDDPRPYLTNFGPKQVLPAELYEKLCYDIDEMKNKWAEVVGFKASELVGTIAPEITPGKYACQDKDKYPGLKELMWPLLYERFAPGGPPHGGNIPEFELVPTRQYYWALPVATATLENMGKTKLDDQGYPDWTTWKSGYPFPRPSGEFKAQQIMYNVERRYLAWDGSFYMTGAFHGYTKNLKRDFDGIGDVTHIKLAGRLLMEPYGWFDERAKERGEYRAFVMGFLAPRDVAGAAQSALYYLDINTADQLMMYIPSLRRIRKMSATDSQDPMMGQDGIYDDNEGFMQKLSPTRYPYTYAIVEEKEFLVPAPTWDGAEYISSEGLEFRGLKFERRPLYVVKLAQQDPNYVYSARIFYIDKETFNYVHIENFDRKGRLYRTFDTNYGWHPEMGMSSWFGTLDLHADHIDQHCSVQQYFQVPAFWGREDVSLMGLVKRGK